MRYLQLGLRYGSRNIGDHMHRPGARVQLTCRFAGQHSKQTRPWTMADGPCAWERGWSRACAVSAGVTGAAAAQSAGGAGVGGGQGGAGSHESRRGARPPRPLSPPPLPVRFPHPAPPSPPALPARLPWAPSPPTLPARPSSPAIPTRPQLCRLRIVIITCHETFRKIIQLRSDASKIIAYAS